MSDLTGQTIGQYQLTEKLGAGGMAEVYKAYQPRLDRYVALKFIRPELAVDDNFRARFEQEARAIAQLSHGNIVHIYDFGEEAHRYFLVMEFVPGQTLKQFVQAQSQAGSPASLSEVVNILRQVGAALDYAHGRGIVHRDVKPDNILLTADGRAVLSDFGIAKLIEGEGNGLTQTGTAVGTPAYMAPEQIQGIKEQIGPTTDLYALGVILYELFTGQTPFTADTPFAVMLKHVSDPVPLPQSINPALPLALESVLLKTLAKQPDERYPSAEALLTAVEQALAEGNGAHDKQATLPPVIAFASSDTTPDPSSAATVVDHAPPTAVASTPPATTVTANATPTSLAGRAGRKWVFGVVGLLVLVGLVAVAALVLSGAFASDTPGTITFTAGGEVYRVEALPRTEPENISSRLNNFATGQDTSLNVSPDGAWLVIETTRADEACAGWACLALVPSSLTLTEATAVYLPNFDVVHTDSLPALGWNAEQLVYVAEGDNIRDLFLLERDDEGWSDPILLTALSPYAYNDLPRLHPHDDVVLFICGDEPYGGGNTAVCEVDLDNLQVDVIIRREDGPLVSADADGLYTADYLPNGSVVFTAPWRNSDIWRTSSNNEQFEPIRLDPPLSGDLGCVLPNGAFTVLQWNEALGGPTIRVVSLDGTTDYIIDLPIPVDYDSVGCGG